MREAVLKISMLHLGAKLMTGGYIHIPKKKKKFKRKSNVSHNYTTNDKATAS